MLDLAKLEVSEKVTITKFAEGVDPNTGEPFDTVEHECVVYKGEDAFNKLTQAGLTYEQIVEMTKNGGNKNGTY